MKLTSEVVKDISKIKNEPEWMTKFRLNAWEHFINTKEPNFGPKLKIDYDAITYYKKRSEELTNDWEKISCAIRNEFKDLGVIDAENKYLDGMGAQYDSDTETRIYFDKDGIYFINRTSKSMQLNGYDEYLFDQKTKNLIFSYSRGAEEGQVFEWRYYFDENGDCIETKTTNTDETDDGFYDKRAAKDFQAIFDLLNGDEE